jgi:hypothetical protein
VTNSDSELKFVKPKYCSPLAASSAVQLFALCIAARHPICSGRDRQRLARFRASRNASAAKPDRSKGLWRPDAPVPAVGLARLDYKNERLERKLRSPVCPTRHIDKEIFMSSKLLASALLAASLLAAPTMAFAQTSAPPDSTGPSGEATPAPKTIKHHAMSTHAKYRQHAMNTRGTHFRAGTTTGLASGAGRARPGGQSVARKPAD